MRLPGGYEIRRIQCADCNTWGVAFDWSGHWGWAVGWRLRLRGWRHPVRRWRWQHGVSGLIAFEGGAFTFQVPDFLGHLFDLTPVYLPLDTVRCALFNDDSGPEFTDDKETAR